MASFPSGHGHLIPTVEHNLTGDVLCIMGPEDLKEIGITTVGQRLAILKAIYLMKLAHDIPIEPDHYIPPCQLSFFSLLHQYLYSELGIAEAGDPPENISVDKLYYIIREQG